MMDIVYPVRQGNSYEELRYSLRTVETNYRHDNVWIVGHKPNWLTNIGFIPGNIGRPGNFRVYNNILAACQHPDIPESFIAMNDDFFITEPLEQIPIYFHGPLVKQCAGIRKNPKTWWHRSLLLTLEVLQDAGYPDPISYEIHCPLPVDKQAMATALQKFANVERGGVPVQWRTVYGNLNSIGGIQHPDCKARHNGGPILKPFHSTSDASFRFYRRQLQADYPKPSKYEKT